MRADNGLKWDYNARKNLQGISEALRDNGQTLDIIFVKCYVSRPKAGVMLYLQGKTMKLISFTIPGGSKNHNLKLMAGFLPKLSDVTVSLMLLLVHTIFSIDQLTNI